MNKSWYIGRLTRDVQIKETQGGKPMAKFSLAVKRPYSKEEVDFIDFVAWGNLAELCGKYLEKGKQVAVEGYLTTRTYEKEGITIKVYEVRAEDVEFLGNRSTSQEQVDENTLF